VCRSYSNVAANFAVALIRINYVLAAFMYEGKLIIICNAVVFVFLLAALSFCAALPCVVSLSLFSRRFDVARSVPLPLPCC
jgi:hypothetical protein